MLQEPAPNAAAELSYTRREVIYARPHGTALTLDVFRPRQGANGAGIVFPVSEGWYSEHEKIEPNIPLYIAPLLARGYTVFAVIHGSNPKFSLPEYIRDLHRAVRFIRHHAHTYGIDPFRIGGTGDSAGGHLALLLGCAGGPGAAPAADEVDAESSRLQAVVAFFPPTDFLNWGEPGRAMLGEHPLVPLHGAFAFTELDSVTQTFRVIDQPGLRAEIARQVSPITHVTAEAAPTLIVVGDADSFIPPQQSRRMAARLQAAGVPSKLIVVPGGEHDEALVRAHIPSALAWFDLHLAPKSARARP